MAANGDSQSPARVYSVVPGMAFLDSVAGAILSGDLPQTGGKKPELLDLPNVTLILPTPRATRAMQDAFLRASGRDALLLPRITAITDSDEDLNVLTAFLAARTLGEDAIADLPPAIDDIERKIALTRLVLQWSRALARSSAQAAPDYLSDQSSNVAHETPAQAAALAGDLAQLMDTVEREGVSLANLKELVPESFAGHWQATLEFLQILTQHWPEHLKERNLSAKAERRNAAILAEANRLQTNPPAYPVIVAGVTGSIPATAELMRAVAGLPTGAIVLPGLDAHLDDDSWRLIAPHLDTETARPVGHPEHPQYGLKKLLDMLGVDRGDVKPLAGGKPSPKHASRQRFVSEALRPSVTTTAWQNLKDEFDGDRLAEALDDVHLINAPNAQDEAEAIALIMRQTLETPGRTAALVSPDRILARRVGVRLESWGITVDDSAGRPFVKTPTGTFLDLVITALENDFAPPDLVALLKHPFTRLGLDPFTIRKTARALEIAAFRTDYLGRGLAGVDDALHRARLDIDQKRRLHRSVRRIHKEDWDNAHDIVARLQSAYAPLITVYDKHGDAELKGIVGAHLKTAECIGRETDADTEHDGNDNADGHAEQPVSQIWKGAAGDQGSLFFASLLADTQPEFPIAPADYPDLYRSLVSSLNIREQGPVHPRLAIWGLFESRLQHPDVIILGSLNEGVWPATTDPGPWLNRSMRNTLKMPSPEEDIGREALDFSTLMATETVYLTRSEKDDGGTPTVPSRWLLRMQALLAGLKCGHLLAPHQPWSGWARARDSAERIPPIAAPEPRPDLNLRPRKMSVSAVEQWIKNPYAIFARQILDFEVLAPLGKEPGADLRGNIVHRALAQFAEKNPIAAGAPMSPKDIARAVVSEAQDIMAAYHTHPRIAAFWLPRIERFAHWFGETEPQRLADVARVIAETKGELIVDDCPGGAFALTARADRIDITSDGLIITDYKTGTIPGGKAVKTALAPQLLLEAAIVLFGAGFATTENAQRVSGLRFIKASGGTPAGEQRDIAFDDIEAAAKLALDGLKNLVVEYDDPATPYRALRRHGFDYRFDDYDHLARVAEWSGAEPDGGDT